MQAYKQLEQVFLRIYRFQHFSALADWDMQAIMPPKGAEARGAAIAEVELLQHELLTDAKVPALLSSAESGVSELDSIQAANLREMRRTYDSAALVPGPFVEKFALLTSRAQQVWCKCRAENDFPTFLPVLKELVAAFRERGKYLAGDSGKEPYEALVDIYETGMTLQRLDEIFGNVKTWLPTLLKDVIAAQKKRSDSIVPLQPPFPIDKQEALGRYFMGVWKFDFDAGRLDVSAHPFCGNVKEDVRITTNYVEHQFDTSLLGIIHETGHAKYEQNCGPAGYRGQPVCNARSLGIHESQSLFAEMQIARSTEFIEYLTPKVIEYFGEQPGFTHENLTKVLQTVQPGYIRIDADEVSYPLHVILRYEIERDLIRGNMEAEDVPRVWNEKMKEYLGLETLGKDNLGCLQDVHWSGGMFGYFPTYSLGAMTAAQLMATVRKDLGDETVSTHIRNGDLGAIFERQNEMIWKHGCSLLTDDLLVKATGEKLNPEYLHQHLRKRYIDSVQ